jgi:hypothetical protein
MEANQESPSNEKTPRPAGKTAPGVALRIILVLIIGTVIGAAVYFSAAGWIPYIDQRVLNPIENNQNQVELLSASQQALEEQLTDLSSTLKAIENQSPELQSTLTVLENSLDLVVESVDDLSDTAVSNNYLSATYLPSRLSTLEARQESTSRNLSALATAQMDDPLGREDIELLRILELLSRATQFLLHDNYGLARDQLITARDYSEQLEIGPSGLDSTLLIGLQSQIDEAIQDLPARPSIAGVKIELAWNLALEGIQTARFEGTFEPTSIQPTPTPGTLTPTPN